MSYSLREAAELLGVKVRTVREWIRVGKIQAEKENGGWYWRVPESEIRRVNENKN